MRLPKRFLLSLGGTVAVIATGLGCAVSSANCIDTGYEFRWGFFHKVRYSEGRSKDTASSVYMYANAGDTGKSYYAHIEASNGNGWRDVSHGNSYRVQKGSVVLLNNWAKEEGYGSVRIVGESNPGSGRYTGAGVWSPDYC